MRIIDKTPFVDEDGAVSFINRVQGTLQYGFSWYANLQAQQQLIAVFEKHFSKKYTLIRNHTLGKSKITIPLILIGQSGIQVIHVTNLEGTYQAKNDTWGKLANDVFKPDKINLLKRTQQLAKAMEVYLKKQGFQLPSEGVEPILIAANPALHITSVRPIIRVVMSDAVERFATTQSKKPPQLSVEVVHQMAEAILNPRSSQKKAPPPPEPEDDFDPSSYGFGQEKDDLYSAEEKAPSPAKAQPAAKPKPQPKRRPPAKKKAKGAYWGMSKKQLTIIAVMAAFVALMLIALTIGALWMASQG